MRRHLRINQAGFSLLEMLIVVGIMSAAAYVALDTVESNTGQRRYELTELRAQKIRRAIVGDPNLVVNGSPAVFGFVADVGRLPDCLEALITQDPDCNGNGTEDSGDIPSVDAPLDFSEHVSDLSFGWRGPYLTAGKSGLADGWGNTDAGDGNWGWVVATTGTALSVTSLARDRTSVSDVGNYDDDYVMHGIVSNDFSVSLGTTAINIEVINTAIIDATICVAVLAPDPEDVTDWKFISMFLPETVIAGTTQTIAFSSYADATLSLPNRVSHGVRRLIVYDGSNSAVVNANCQPAGTKAALMSSAVLASKVLLFAPLITPSMTLTLSL